jgi:hypothetical protein
MDFNTERLGYVATLLRDAADVNEVNEIWYGNYSDTRGAKLIYASPSPVGIVLPSSKWKIKALTEAYPRCLYSTDNLYLIDDEIIGRSALSGNVPVSVDPSIMLDSNVAGEVRRFILKETPSGDERFAIMDFLAGEHVNISYHQYAFENARNFYMKQGHANFVRETLFYIQWLDHINTESYAKTKDKKPELNKPALWREADKKTLEIYGGGRRGSIKSFLRLHYLTYVVLLKVVEIEFAPGRKRPFEVKLEMLLDFMHEEMHRISLRELLMAARYFKKRDEVSFMEKINHRCRNPLEKLSNIAWDMMLFRTMEKFATVKTPGGFFIPYFISFDEPTRDLFDTYRLKGLIVYGDEGGFINIPQEDDVQKLLNSVEDEDKRARLRRYFDPDVRKLRSHFVARGQDSPTRQLVRRLERKVWRECLESPE